MSISDLRSNLAVLRRDLQANRQIDVTTKGKPFAITTSVGPENLEEQILVIHRARTRAALSRMRIKAKADGPDWLTMGQIEALVAQVRIEK